MADEDDLLKSIASGGIQLALNQLQRDISKTDNELFLDDIYAYLKAWLMFSIQHERDMRVEYIKQRYPEGQPPDREAYEIALQKIKDQLIIPALEKHLDKRLNTTQKNSALQITRERLTHLIRMIRTIKDD